MDCRVMILDIAWGKAIYYFPMEINGEMVREHPNTCRLTKNDFIGVFNFDEKYLNIMESDTMRGIKFYYMTYVIN